ncbi:MAG: hypothetical protein ACI4KM_04740 [Oscillospiraceae bacterium]
MSGPKTSRYKLTPAQRKIIARQRELERQLNEEKAYRIRLLARVKALNGAFSADRYNAKLLAEHSGSDNGFGEMADAFSLRIANLIKELENAQFFSELEDFQRVRIAADKELAKLVEEQAQLERLAAENELALSAALNDKIDAGFTQELRIESHNPPEDSPAARKEQTLNKLRRLQNEPLLSAEIISALQETEQRLRSITDRNFAENFIAVSAARVISQAEKYLENIGMFDGLMARYESLCECCGEQPQAFTPNDIDSLNEKITALEALLVEQSEQAYIAQAIDEVMEDMGYRLLGTRSMQKKSGARFRSELYSYNDGAAVNVTYSSDGKITMELGGLDTADRLPTCAEAQRLRGDMESFCDEYDEFELRLAQKGVIPEHLSLLPPDDEYAQIINTNDYELCEGAAITNITDRKRPAQNNIMRKSTDDPI